MHNVNDALIRAARNYLDITWDDPAGDEKLAGILSRGMEYLDGKAGKDQDYDQETNARALLFDYCRYARANALEEFDANFIHDITALRLSVIAENTININGEIINGDDGV